MVAEIDLRLLDALSLDNRILKHQESMSLPIPNILELETSLYKIGKIIEHHREQLQEAESILIKLLENKGGVEKK